MNGQDSQNWVIAHNAARIANSPQCSQNWTLLKLKIIFLKFGVWQFKFKCCFCMTRNQSLALFVFLSHNYIAIISNWKNCWKTLSNAWMSCWEVWNPARVDWLTVLIPSPSHNWCMVRTAPSLLIWGLWLTYLNQMRGDYSSVPWIAVAQTCGSLIGSHPSSSSISTSPFPMRKSKLTRLLLCLFTVRTLGCLELFSNSHLSIFDHWATGPASRLTITRTVWSEWTWAW